MKKEKSCGAVVYRQGETGVEVLMIARPQPEEVLELRWEPPQEAIALVTYATDREVLQAFLRYLAQS